MLTMIGRGMVALVILVGVAIFVAAQTTLTQRVIATEIEIEASAEEVWQVLTTMSDYPTWNTFMRRADGVVQTGETLSLDLHSGGGVMEIEPTVMVVDAPRQLTWLGRVGIAGIFDGEHTFILEPLEGERTRLIHREVFNGVGVLLAGGLLGETEQNFHTMNQELKAQAERTP